MYDDSIWSQPPQRIKRTLSQKLSIMNHDVFVSSLSKLSQSKSWHMSQRTVHPSHSQCFDHRCQSWHYVVESAETLPGTIGTPQSQQRCEYAPLSYQDLRLRFEMVFFGLNQQNRQGMTRWNTLGHVLAPNLRRDCVRGPNPAKKFHLSERSRIFKNQDPLRSTKIH